MTTAASTLLLEEFFEHGDDRFFQELVTSQAAGKLRSFATKWLSDERPFARKMLLRYIDDGCDRPNHRPLVKALFKQSEAKGDDELMAHFLVTFDRSIHRQIVPQRTWDSITGGWIQTKRLVRDRSVPGRDWQAWDFKKVFENRAKLKIVPTTLPRFSRRTRSYLERRAFRYFRLIGKKDLARYRTAMLRVLSLYRDEHLKRPEQFLDAWGLVHALYWGSPILDRKPDGVRLKEGSLLSQLEPAPIYPEAWKGCLDELITLLQSSNSRTVRSWTLKWLRREYAPTESQKLPLGTKRALLGSAHEEVQLFGAELLKTATGLEAWPLADWLELLKIENTAVIPLICELVEKHVTPSRLTLAQCVELACAPVAPVGELGLKWAKGKPVRGEIDLGVLTQLSAARTEVVRKDAAPWVCEQLSKSPQAKPEHLRELLDSRFSEMREAALALLQKDARFGDSTLLWGALSESPYDDSRGVLVKHLGEREKSLDPSAIRYVWATTLLGVHRGGRTKQIVLNRVAERVSKQPGEASELLPLLAIALRSVRGPERRGALAAVARATVKTPALKDALQQHIPELKLHEGVPA